MFRWSGNEENPPDIDLSTFIHPEIAKHEFFVNILAVPEFEINQYVINTLVPSINSMLNEKGGAS